jgi:hypothetical protein
MHNQRVLGEWLSHHHFDLQGGWLKVFDHWFHHGKEV